MFGQQKDTDEQETTHIPNPMMDAAASAAMGDDQAYLASPAVAPSIQPSDPSWQHPGTPVQNDTPTAEPTPAPTHDEPTPSVTPSTSIPDDIINPDTNELIDIKQKALTQLSPLVGHLDQTPEEQFRTTMMMIQASDDQSMIKTAYEAAQKISDEKVRAQALLDIVNEINYFTQTNPDPK